MRCGAAEHDLRAVQCSVVASLHLSYSLQCCATSRIPFLPGAYCWSALFFPLERRSHFLQFIQEVDSAQQASLCCPAQRLVLCAL